MESEPSWLMLALALGLVLALTGVAVWLSVTEVRAVRPVPAVARPGRWSLRPGRPDGAGRPDAPGRPDGGTATAADDEREDAG